MGPSDYRSVEPLSSSWRRLWPPVAVLLLIAAVGFGILVATGRVVVGLRANQPPPGKLPASTPLPSGPSIRLVRDASRYFEIMDYEASLFEYSNGLVDCWVEVDVDGERIILPPLHGTHLLTGSDSANSSESLGGHILFVRYKVPRGPRGPEEGEQELFDLIMTMPPGQNDEQGRQGTALRRWSVPEFTRWSRLTSFQRYQHEGGPLRPGEDLVLYEKQEWMGTRNSTDVSTRVVRVKCRLASARPVTQPTTQSG